MKRCRKLPLFALAGLLLAGLFGCAPRTIEAPAPPSEHAPDAAQPFASIEVSAPEGQHSYGIIADYYISGEIVLTAKPFAQDFGAPYPSATTSQAKSQASEMRAALLALDPASLESETEMTSSDGAFYRITIYTDEGAFTITALNPTGERFLAAVEILGPPADAGELLREPFERYVMANADEE